LIACFASGTTSFGNRRMDAPDFAGKPPDRWRVWLRGAKGINDSTRTTSFEEEQ
jgi:hypothetical protein